MMNTSVHQSEINNIVNKVFGSVLFLSTNLKLRLELKFLKKLRIFLKLLLTVVFNQTSGGICWGLFSAAD